MMDAADVGTPAPGEQPVWAYESALHGEAAGEQKLVLRYAGRVLADVRPSEDDEDDAPRAEFEGVWWAGVRKNDEYYVEHHYAMRNAMSWAERTARKLGLWPLPPRPTWPPPGDPAWA